jgi:hypothetical protein
MLGGALVLTGAAAITIVRLIPLRVAQGPLLVRLASAAVVLVGVWMSRRARSG